MTRLAQQYPRISIIVGGAVLVVAYSCSGGGGAVSDSASLIDPITAESLRNVTTHVKPIPERGDEYAGHPTPHDSLGGPYKKFKSGSVTNAATAGAPVALDTMVADATLATYLDALNFDNARDNGELAAVRCAPGSPAECSALLYIEPEIGMKKRAHRDIPPFGMVVARIINYSSTETDSTYRIPPLTRAYWYVYNNGSSLRSRIFIRTPGATRKLKVLGTEKSYDTCTHAPIPGVAQAKFRTCDRMTYETAAARPRDRRGFARVPNPFIHPASYTPGPSAPPPGADVDALRATDLWVKCAQGCCIAG